jgi:hypothetical protein
LNGRFYLAYSRITAQIVTLAVGNSDKELQNQEMLKKLRDLYREYKPYIRVDLVMYGVLILLIMLYFIISVVF